MPDHKSSTFVDSASRPRAQERVVNDPAALRPFGRSEDSATALRTSGRAGKKPSPAIPPVTKVSPEKVLHSFNTWAFKREQPSDPHLMLQFISEAINHGEPVPFVLYWGKGPRCRLDQPDIECLDFLATFARRVREAYKPGAAIKLIFTDTHAELNGYSHQSIRQYFTEIDVSARQRGFASCWLGPLIRAPKTIAASAPMDDIVPEETRLRLSASALKWYRGEGTAEQGALKYYQMNIVEKRAVETAFPRSIFITFNGSNLRVLIPKRLPIYYMYSLRRGIGVKPWFLPAGATPCDASSCRCIVQES